MFGIGIPELIIILLIGLIVFGPGRLPEIGKAIGNSVNEFKRALLGPRLEDKDKSEKKES